MSSSFRAARLYCIFISRRLAMPYRPKSRVHARFRQKLNLEALDCRLAPSVVVGSVFFDAHGDGTHQSGEPGMPGVIVYLDVNGDNQFNPPTGGTINDPFAQSGFDGHYFLHANVTGTFNVAQVVPNGLEQSTPTPPLVSVTAG